MEKLEQLRALDMGCRMKVVKTEDFGIGVDTPEDVAKAKGSFTGQYLAPMLKKKSRRKAA